jgi:hypothetical protein
MKKVLTSYRFPSQTLDTNSTSESTNTQFFDRVCYALDWTGSAEGTILVQGSVDNVNFSNLDMNPIVMNAEDDSAVIDIQTTSLPYVRLSYTSTAGTGTLNAVISGKES